MSWPWSRRRDERVDDAGQARRSAEAKLRDTNRTGAEVRELTNKIRQARRQNRFAELIERTMGLR